MVVSSSVPQRKPWPSQRCKARVMEGGGQRVVGPRRRTGQTAVAGTRVRPSRRN